MRIHISLLNCRGEEKMPARPCPVRSVRSGPSGPLQCPGPKAPGPDRPDGPDRTGQGRVGIFSSPGIHIHSHIYIYTSTWHLPIGARDGHIITLSNVINANCSSKAELKLFAGRGTKGLLCHKYIYIFYMCICVSSKITKLLWSNTPSLLEQKLVLEQPSITFRAIFVLEQLSITFGAKYCFGATLHHFLSKRLFWSNASSLLVQKLVLEQHSIAFQTKKDEVIWGPGPKALERTGRTGPDRTWPS